MENAVRISVPVWVTILIITVVFPTIRGMGLSAEPAMETGSKQMENVQLPINQMLLGIPFHRYLHRISAYRRAAAIRSGTCEAIDHMDGDISEKLEFYGQVKPDEKGYMRIRSYNPLIPWG